MTAPDAPVRLYGVVDCAVEPTLHEHVQRLGPQQAACLFEGKLDPGVLAVSPYLVELSPHDPLSRAWRGSGWGRNWGLLVSSRSPLMAVRRRLRHFTQARLPDGSGPVLFRFWDPRVFRVYFPQVDGPGLADWFKDISHFTVESEDGARSLRYSLGGGRLVLEEGPAPNR